MKKITNTKFEDKTIMLNKINNLAKDSGQLISANKVFNASKSLFLKAWSLAESTNKYIPQLNTNKVSPNKVEKALAELNTKNTIKTTSE